MIVKYDSLDRLEVPKLTLCNPGSIYNSLDGSITKVVGVLTDHEAEEIVFNFNATSELNFRINRLHNFRDYTAPADVKTNLGEYTLISGSFATGGDAYFSGLAGAGIDHERTTDNYRTPNTSTIAVFQYKMNINIPDGAIVSSVSCEVNGHAQSTSSSSEYMCVKLKSGNTDLSAEYNFKTSGTSNTTITLTPNVTPTAEQLASMVLECRVGRYGGAINGATCLVNYLSGLSADEIEEYKAIDSRYKAVQNRRLIFADDLGYFIITNITEGYDGHHYYKDVTAESADIELQQKMIPYIADGTYRFETDDVEGINGLLNMIVETLPGWLIGDVDEAISEKWRTFEDVDVSTNCLAFLLENMQDAYECIFVFDPINRLINVYDQMNYVRETRIHITNDDVINSLDIKESADDIYTAITAIGGDDSITIAAVNPIGGNTIYNFTYYLDWMSPELRAKVVQWMEDVESQESAYQVASETYYTKLADASTERFEIDRLTTQLMLYQRCKDNITASGGTAYVSQYNDAISGNGGTPININQQISEIKAEISARISECQSAIETHQASLDALVAQAEVYRDAMNSIISSLAIETYFITGQEDTSLLDELQNFIFEGSYTDEYVIVTDIMSFSEKYDQMKTMYNRAKRQLLKVSHPTQEFSVDVENFIFAKDFQAWSEDLETGCLISVEINEDDIAKLFLSSMTVNYDDHDMSMTFGNRFNRFDPKALFDNVLGSVSKSANTLNYMKDILYPIKSGEFDVVKNTLQRSRDLTMGAALAADNQEVVIDASGYTGREIMDTGEHDPRQIKITGRNIVFTDDAWESSKTAIGEIVARDGSTAYGVNAELLVGDMIVGENIRILGDDGNGNPTDIFSIVDNKISTQVSDLMADTETEIGNINSRVSFLEQTAGGITATVENWTTNGIDSVRTGRGYTFDDTGLTITDLSDSGSGIRNLIKNDGMYVQLVEEGSNDPINVLMATDQGVDAYNLTAHNYLTIGLRSRFEDYRSPTASGLTRTACFYIG